MKLLLLLSILSPMFIPFTIIEFQYNLDLNTVNINFLLNKDGNVTIFSLNDHQLKEIETRYFKANDYYNLSINKTKFYCGSSMTPIYIQFISNESEIQWINVTIPYLCTIGSVQFNSPLEGIKDSVTTNYNFLFYFLIVFAFMKTMKNQKKRKRY